MKHLRFILLLLAVGFTQIAFSQDLAKKWEEEDKFKSAIEQVLTEADTEEEAEKKISSLLEGDGNYITKQDKANIANEYFEKCKKKLAKWDAKLAAGKNVYPQYAMYAANYYILGFKKICNQDYSKALEYIKLCPQIPVTKMYTVALQYQLNKDKAAALAAMSFINKPSKQLSNVASQYGLADVYHEKLMSLLAEKKQALKRAIRSKDFDTLLSFIPYDIPEVDSLFATSDVDIAIAKGLTSGKIEEVEDFDDRNIIKIYDVGYYDDNWSSHKDEYKDYFIKKCLFKHEMSWALQKVMNGPYDKRPSFTEIAESYPVKLLMQAFTLKDKRQTYMLNVYEEFYRINDWLYGWCHDNNFIDDKKILHYIETLKSRNILASFLVAVMVQVYGNSYTPVFKAKLFNITKEIVDQAPLLKNNEALPIIIDSNGKVTTKENCKSQETEKIYEPIMNFILAEYNKNKDK